MKNFIKDIILFQSNMIDEKLLGVCIWSMSIVLISHVIAELIHYLT